MRRAVKLLVLLSLIAALITPGMALSNTTPPSPASGPDQGGGEVRVYNDRTGQLNFVGFPANLRSRAANNAAAAQDIASNFATQFGMGPDSALNLAASRRSRGGSYYRYQQLYRGVPVVGGEMIINSDRQNRLAAVSGEFSDASGLSTSPAVSSANAAQDAIRYVARAEGADPAALRTTSPQLWVYDAALISPYVQPAELVWRLTVYADGLPIRYDVLVNAHVGGVRLAINEIHTLLTPEQEAVAHQVLNDDVPEVPAELRGPGLPPVSPNLPNYNAVARTYDSNSTLDINGQDSPFDGDNVNNSILQCQTTQPGTPNQLSGSNSCTNGVLYDADAAHFFALQTHDIYDLYFGRNSIDNNGLDIYSNVDYREAGAVPFANAFWDGESMIYGDSGFWPADDVVAHELTHGVTQYTSDLFYYYESGAINEAMSDVFGEFVDQLNGINSFGAADNAGDRWLMGEDLDGPPLRSMSNPPAYGDPDSTQSGNYYAPDAVNGNAGDNGGVHTNSGVANKAAFLMVDGGSFGGYAITPLAANKIDSYILTANIWYEAQYLLPSGADYGQLFGALSTACNNLLGQSLPGTGQVITAADCVEVAESTLATGMHLEPAYAGYSPEASRTCPIGQTLQQLYFKNFESGTSGFSFSASDGNPQWIWIDNYAHTGDKSLVGIDDEAPSAAGKLNRAAMNTSVGLTGGQSYYLYFWHSFGFEDYLLSGDNKAYDGAILEYSTNGGSSWINAGSLIDSGRNYNGTVVTGFGNPLGGSNAFVYDSHGYVSTRLNLTSLAGQNVRFRWVIGTDDVGSDLGWVLDDVEIYRCGSSASGPNLAVSATCNGPDLAVNITSGEGPFNITASAGINLPRYGVNLGTTVINGPEKWDNLTVTETSGNFQSVNLGQFRCYPNGRPIQLSPPHRSILSNPYPIFTYQAFPDATNYRVWVFDDADPGLRTVDIRENSGGALSMQLSQPLSSGRYFWRLRARVNRIWSRWSTRWMFRIDTGAAADVLPTLELEPTLAVPTATEVPQIDPQPSSTVAPGATLAPTLEPTLVEPTSTPEPTLVPPTVEPTLAPPTVEPTNTPLPPPNQR